LSTPAKFVFENGNNQWLEWGPLVDGLTQTNPAPTYINDATVTATLYKNRVIGDPTQPGTLAPTFGVSGSLTLPYIAASTGIYRGLVPNALAEIVGANFVLVIDASDASNFQGHWELPAQIITRPT
jgi:hypothetical protein